MTLRLRRPFAIAALLLVVAGRSGAQQTRLVDRAPDGLAAIGYAHSAAMSRDGEFIAFDQSDESLLPLDGHPNDNVFVVERTTGLVTLESVSTGGVEADDDCGRVSISADGRFVLFVSKATTLVPGEAPPFDQAYLRDRAAGTTRRISVAADGGFVDADCTATAISGDGSFACFETAARNILAGLPGGNDRHLFGVDLATGAVELLTRASDGAILEFGGSDPSIDREGRCVVFTSISRNHSDRDDRVDPDVLLRDRVTGVTEWISDPGSNHRFRGSSNEPGISADGRFVAFASFEHAIFPDEPQAWIVYLRDRELGVTTNETPGIELTGHSSARAFDPRISDDGRFLAYATMTNLVEEDFNQGVLDIYLRDRLLDRLEVASVGETGSSGLRSSTLPSLSGDGRIIAFLSEAHDFVADDGLINRNVFVREWPRDRASWASYGQGFAGRDGVIPTLTAVDAPHIGAPLSIDISNSSRNWTFGFLYAGLDAIDVPTSLGGRLLVAPIANLPVPLPPTGWRETTDLDLDWSLSGFVVRAQVLELDPYAAKGVSFTAGIELVLGY